MKKSTVWGILLSLIIFLFSLNQVNAQENATGVVVKLRSNSDLMTMVDSLTQFKAYNNQNTSLNTTQFKPLFGNYYLVKNTNIPIETLLSQFKQNPNIEYAERDQNLTFAALPNDPLYSSQYHHSLMNAPVAWDKTTGSNSVIVAIVDTGVDYTHPDLAPNMWRNANNEVGYDFGDGDNDPMDIQGHGTHMAGVIGAVGNNFLGVTGINWKVKIMAVKVVGINALSAPTSTVANGIRFAADNGARVINMSFGAPGIYSQTIVDAINYAYSKGAVIVASSGNYVCPSVWFPANQPNVVAAGAVDESDMHPSFSCSGNELDLAAPAVHIITTDRGGIYTPGTSNTGTSYASAMVSGAAALVIASQPSLSNTDVIFRLENTAVDLGPAGKDTLYGYGRVNLGAAVQNSPIPTVTPTITTTPNPTVTPYPTYFPSPTPSACVYKTVAQVKDENGTIIDVSGTNVGLRIEYKFTANNGQYYEGDAYFTHGQHAQTINLEPKFQNIFTEVILHQDRNIYDLQESRTFCYDKGSNKSCKYSYAQTVQAQLVCGGDIEYGWVIKKRNFEPMPTIIYPTQPPQYPTATPIPNQGGLQIYPSVGQGATVKVGQIIKVCYKVPQYGKFIFTTITDTWQTNKFYIDDGTGDCLVRQIVNPIGKHTYRITMNGVSAETYVVVSGQFEPGYHPYDQVIPLETVQ